MSDSAARRLAIEALALELALGASAPILTAVESLYREVDQEVRAKSLKAEMPCRAGCDACCRESVFLCAPEFFFVVAHMAERWSDAEIRTLLDQMSQLARRFADEFELLETISPGDERDEVAARVKFDCPFLAESRCRIYEARELNARTFGLSWDTARGEGYGCELTHARLRVLPPETGLQLAGARELRARLVERVPQTEVVHVYPWWFDRYRASLERLFG